MGRGRRRGPPPAGGVMTFRIDCELTDAQATAVRDAIARGAMEMACGEDVEDDRTLRTLRRACGKMVRGMWEPASCPARCRWSNRSTARTPATGEGATAPRAARPGS